MKEVKMGMGRRRENGGCLVFVCRGLGFVRRIGGRPKDSGGKVCEKRGLEVNAGKSKVTVLGGEEGL